MIQLTEHMKSMRYFQLYYWNAEGKPALTSSIALIASRIKSNEDILKHTTSFVRSRLISIWEVAS